MSNRPNFKRGTTIAEFAQRRYDEGTIEIPITVDDAGPISVPPREFWPQPVREMMERQGNPGRKKRPTDEDIARALIGDDQFERFAAEVAAGPAAEYAGGPGSFFFLYLQNEWQRQQGVTLGELLASAR